MDEEEVSSPSHLSETTHNSYLSKAIEDVNNGNSDGGGGGGGGGSITSTLDSIPNHSNRDLSNPTQPSRSLMKKKNKRVLKEGFGSSSSPSTQHKGLRVMNKRRNPKVLFGGGGGRCGESDLDAIALPLGMSFAAVVAQVLDSKTIADERISADHLSMSAHTTIDCLKSGLTGCLGSQLVIISAGGWSFKRCFIRIDDRLVLAEICTSAVKESLANVFGDRFDSFVRNFEKSFGSTLRTLRMINKASIDKGIDLTGHSSREDYGSDVPHSTLNKQGHPFSGSSMTDCQSEAVPPTCGLRNPFAFVEEVKETFRPCSMNQELIVHGQTNQHLTSVSQSTLGSGVYQPMMNTLEKSVMEQARSNDLKAFEIGLRMEKLRLTKSQLALSSDSYSLEKFKLSMGISKASFREEKFKTQLEDTRHGELLKKCIDCLVAGLFIMSSSLLYGAYTYSYQRITEATSSCLSPPKESKSWFIPKSVSSFNSGLHSIRCQVEVFSRMLFGVLMILCIAYLLLQRSSAPNQTMPITFILLLLCGVCGFAGKLCVDTIGGSGYVWLLYWEVLCMLHFFANIFTSALFFLLHGSLSVTQETKASTKLPFWIRRVVFYAVMVVLLPLSCGLMPFAGLGDWKDHFSSLAIEALYRSAIYERS